VGEVIFLNGSETSSLLTRLSAGFFFFERVVGVSNDDRSGVCVAPQSAGVADTSFAHYAGYTLRNRRGDSDKEAILGGVLSGHGS